MKFNALFICVLGFSLTACQEKEASPMDLAKDMEATFESKSSMSYDIDYRIKYFSSLDDTTKVSAKIDLIRVPGDSVLGGYVWIHMDSTDRYYDTQHLYFIDHKTKSITRYTKEQPYIITGNTIGEAIRVYYLNPERLTKGVSDTTNIVSLTHEVLKDRHVWKIHYDFPEDEYSENTWKNIWIDQNDLSVVRINFSTDWQGENQYNQWNLSNIRYDSVTISDLDNRLEAFLTEYEVSDYEESKWEQIQPLSTGTSIPDPEGTLYPDSTRVHLSDLLGQLTLIDFWYMDCFPCIQAIPHLNNLFSKYRGQGFQVIGLNPFNHNEKDLKRLPNFLDHNPIDYPFVFIDREISQSFHVTAYPTFYLVDKSGTILHSEIGFSEENTAKLDSLIRVKLHLD
jgi:thiol-disulfide isomerase/thioredoxin